MLTLLVEGGLLLFAYGLGYVLHAPPFARRAGDPLLAIGVGALATLPLLALFAWSMRSRWRSLRRIRELLLEGFMPLLSGSGPFELFLIALLAGVCEEALFRGVIQVALGDWLGAVPGLVLASILFGVAHAVTPAYLLLATVMGAYLGGLLWWSGGLLAPIVAHTLYDFVALWILQRHVSGTRAASAEPGTPV